jgi:hypothetical protein
MTVTIDNIDYVNYIIYAVTDTALCSITTYNYLSKIFVRQYNIIAV